MGDRQRKLVLHQFHALDRDLQFGLEGLQHWEPEGTAWEKGMGPLQCQDCMLKWLPVCLQIGLCLTPSLINASLHKLLSFWEFFCRHHLLIFWVLFSYLSLFYRI